MRRVVLSASEKVEIWRRRDKGESPSRIARHIGRPPTLVRRYVQATGGVQPRQARRPERALTVGEREEISRGLAANESSRVIARRLRRAHTSVSREVARNGGRERYRAGASELAAVQRRRRPKPSKLALCAGLRTEVESKLHLQWSPHQISGWLRREHPDLPEMQISAETIYLSLYIQSRGVFRKELTRELRTRRQIRQAGKQVPTGRGHIPDRIMISERPAEANDRAVPGHWEGDILLGRPTDGIGTLVERSTRFTMLFRLEGGRVNADAVRAGLTASIQTLPQSLRRSLTLDQGREMSQHARFTVDTGVQVYFCDPHSPWQRGSNENTNGLLRQYFPKGRSLARVTQAELDFVADRLNGRPRQTLGFRNPAQTLAALLSDSPPVQGGAATA